MYTNPELRQVLSGIHLSQDALLHVQQDRNFPWLNLRDSVELVHSVSESVATESFESLHHWQELALATIREGVVDLLVLLPLHLDQHKILCCQSADTGIKKVVLGVELEEVRFHGRLGDAFVDLHCRVESLELGRELRNLEQHVVRRGLLVLTREVIRRLTVVLKRFFLVILTFVDLSDLLLQLRSVREATSITQHGNSSLEVLNGVRRVHLGQRIRSILVELSRSGAFLQLHLALGALDIRIGRFLHFRPILYWLPAFSKRSLASSYFWVPPENEKNVDFLSAFCACE